ncbi:MAG: hypothetical protein J5842_06260, partial [Lachnospiraceae bacterium]|nr:hypothetical protein [Lachnospiraceae bacterium]
MASDEADMCLSQAKDCRKEARMGISAIGGYGAAAYYSQSLASGSRINRAADGASEMAILQKENAQVRGLDAGAENISEGKNALNIADG